MLGSASQTNKVPEAQSQTPVSTSTSTRLFGLAKPKEKKEKKKKGKGSRSQPGGKSHTRSPAGAGRAISSHDMRLSPSHQGWPLPSVQENVEKSLFPGLSSVEFKDL